MHFVCIHVYLSKVALMIFFLVGSGPNGIEDIKTQPFFNTIDFDKLYKRVLNPPFKPAVVQTDDAFYFDPEFTSRTPKGWFL